MFPAHLRRASRRSPPVERGAFHKRFHITPRRCYPIHQAKYPIGALPRVCWDEGYQKVVKRRMVCNPMTVRIPPPNRKRLRNFFLSSPASNGPDPCAKELAADANVERKKRTVEEEEQIFLDGQKTKRRRNDSSGGGHLAGDSLMTIRAPASHTTKPEARKRSLTSESSDDSVSNSKISTHIAGILSFGDRNAISSSYSSTLGTSISQLCKRNSSPSSRPQVLERPAKKAREEELCQPSSSSAPDTVSEDKVTDKLSQGKKAPDTDTKKQPNSGTLLSITGRSGTRKRKTQLLRPRRGVPLTLPPAPQVGYTVTAEDLDQEKRERLQRINEALEDKDKDKAVSSSVMEKPPTTQPSLTSTVPDTGPTFSSASLPDPDARLLLESWKNMQNCRHTQVFPKQAGTTTSALVPTKTPNLSHGPIGTSLPGLQRNNSSDALLGPAPTFSRTQVFDIKTPAAPQAETPAIAQGLPAPLPTTDPGMLFVVPCHLPSNPSCSAAPDVSSAYYTFQILFLSPNRSDSGSACVPSPSSTMALASSSTFPTKTSTTITGDSKPVIGSIVPSNSVPLSTPFFKQPTSTATTAPVFTGLATTTSTVASVTTTSSSTESASKPIFGFGVNGVASSSVSTSNLIPFGAAPASVSGLPKNENSEFNFQQPLPVSTLAAVTSFGQPLCSVTLMTSSSSSNTCTTTTITSCSGFPTSLPTTLAATTNQQYLTFPNITTPTFNLPFASSAKCTPQPYPGPNTQPAFGATQEQQQQATGPGFAPSSGNSFTFGNTLGPSAAPASAQTQLATSGSERIAFAGQKGTASALHTSASMQPTFGGTSTVSSFRIVASGFPAPTQTYTRTSSSTFGRSTPSPFTFGDSAAPAGSWNLGLDAATPGNSNNSGAFSFRARQSRISTPFGGGRLQPHLRNVLKPNQGFLGIQPFGSAAPSFAGGAGSKNPGPRQILQARRQHSRKK